jgi:hypothetical protein
MNVTNASPLMIGLPVTWSTLLFEKRRTDVRDDTVGEPYCRQQTHAGQHDSKVKIGHHKFRLEGFAWRVSEKDLVNEISDQGSDLEKGAGSSHQSLLQLS